MRAVRARFFLNNLLCLGFALGIGTAASATTPVVTVTLPTNNSTVPSQVHYVATASSPQCAKGIAAMRIYSAPSVGAYTVNSNSLDTNITLSPGTYNTVVQAWDNCGGVGKTPVTIIVKVTSVGGGQPAKFLYSTDYVSGKVYGYVINPTTGALTPNGQNPPWAHWGPTRVASDKGGYRLYVVNQGSKDVNGYFINRSNGYLSSIPGSPFSIGTVWNVHWMSPVSGSRDDSTFCPAGSLPFSPCSGLKSATSFTLGACASRSIVLSPSVARPEAFVINPTCFPARPAKRSAFRTSIPVCTLSFRGPVTR